jgi:Integrase core domain
MSKETTLVLEVINQGLRSRDYRATDGAVKLIHHSDAGSQYTSFRFTQNLLDAGVDASIGTAGDALDNAPAESTIGLYKTELIAPQGPWHDLLGVDVATVAWVEWYNNHRIHWACGGRPQNRVRDPVRARRPDQPGRLTQATSLYQTRGGSVTHLMSSCWTSWRASSETNQSPYAAGVGVRDLDATASRASTGSSAAAMRSWTRPAGQVARACSCTSMYSMNGIGRPNTAPHPVVPHPSRPGPAVIHGDSSGEQDALGRGTDTSWRLRSRVITGVRTLQQFVHVAALHADFLGDPQARNPGGVGSEHRLAPLVPGFALLGQKAVDLLFELGLVFANVIQLLLDPFDLSPAGTKLKDFLGLAHGEASLARRHRAMADDASLSRYVYHTCISFL